MHARQFQLIDTGVIRQRVVIEGHGPLLVLVHGWPESWYSWRHQIDVLVAAGYRVAVPDVRGYGGSDKPEAIEAYDLTSLSDDVIGLIHALGESQAILIGHDWGAGIAWATAIRYARHIPAVAGLSLPYFGLGPRPMTEVFAQLYAGRFCYPLYFQRPGVAEAELEADIPASIRKILYLSSGDVSEAVSAAVRNKPVDAGYLDGVDDPDPLPAWLSEDDVAYYAGEFEHSGFRGSLNRYRNFERDFEQLPELRRARVPQPALFISGARDPVLGLLPGANLVDVLDRWYDDLRGKVIIEGGGHWIQQERPAQTNAALLDFLAGLDNAG